MAWFMLWYVEIGRQKCILDYFVCAYTCTEIPLTVLESLVQMISAVLQKSFLPRVTLSLTRFQRTMPSIATWGMTSSGWFSVVCIWTWVGPGLVRTASLGVHSSPSF